MKEGDIYIDPVIMVAAYADLAYGVDGIVKKHGSGNVAVFGIKNDGKRMIGPLKQIHDELYGNSVAYGNVDITMTRDDVLTRQNPLHGVTEMPTPAYDITDKVIVIVDSVIETGRTLRAAIDELERWGRPKSILHYVLIDRGNRELPYHPDYVFADDTSLLLPVLPDGLVAKLVEIPEGHAMILRERAA